jgi:release factor glutamine methyltransferase
MTIMNALDFGMGQLADFEYPRLEASVLLCHCLGISREKLHTMPSSEISPDNYTEFFALIKERKAGIPSAYLTGRKEFFSRDFTVNSGVLIPRPDTEILVETAIDIFQRNNFVSILDLCTGSGCIAVTLQLELPGAAVSASDISDDAQTVFYANCKKHNVSIPFYKSDLFDKIECNFDMIISNPPYLTNSEVDAKINNKPFEPELALRAGYDGLDKIRIIAAKALDSLRDDGYLLLEAAPEQCTIIAGLLKDQDYSDIKIIKDLAGRDRVITGKKNGNKT